MKFGWQEAAECAARVLDGHGSAEVARSLRAAMAEAASEARWWRCALEAVLDVLSGKESER
jgi:hypothetical protein